MPVLLEQLHSHHRYHRIVTYSVIAFLLVVTVSVISLSKSLETAQVGDNRSFAGGGGGGMFSGSIQYFAQYNCKGRPYSSDGLECVSAERFGPSGCVNDSNGGSHRATYHYDPTTCAKDLNQCRQDCRYTVEYDCGDKGCPQGKAPIVFVDCKPPSEFCGGQLKECVDDPRCTVAISPTLPVPSLSPTPIPKPNYCPTYGKACTQTSQCTDSCGEECNTTPNTPGYGTCTFLSGTGGCSKAACRNNRCVQVYWNPGPNGCGDETDKCHVDRDCGGGGSGGLVNCGQTCANYSSCMGFCTKYYSQSQCSPVCSDPTQCNSICHQLGGQ